MLLQFAERELRAAGLLDKGSDYDGMLGKAVLELVKVFAAQGHSGASAHLTIDLFRRVASYQPLTPLKNPLETGEYLEIGEEMSPKGAAKVLQSTRKSSVFSNDGGRTWIDIDLKPTWWERLLGHSRGRKVKFA